ncbi:hypothetical protein L2E82_42441 [Cichorium intybus]|uniref:Uncharacterized protein n=1 Tax=Cichorium intybus TaxID=13427 RepID=A0ACB8ZMI6_CICIN|nr:hypothetical protein L2E82_42441 [Cichorium intybus]
MQHTKEVMSSGCIEQHRFHPSHQIYLANKKSLRDIDIPPRKLLSRRASASSPEALIDSMYHQQQNESPRVLPEDTLFKKFLPYNSGVDSDEEDADPYSADHFRIYEFKVRKCTRSRSHDWTDCPFAHPGEKARRRCPRRYNYLGTVCADFRRGSCSRGDSCEFAHGVFECWLHPSRYRTEACKDGKNCQRKICFFAHTPRQLRVVPPETTVPVKKHHTESCHCCAHCRSLSETMNELISNPSLNELMRSMEAMTVEENEFPNMNSQWVDACFNNGYGGVYDFSDSTPTPCGSTFSRSSSSSQNCYVLCFTTILHVPLSLAMFEQACERGIKLISLH